MILHLPLTFTRNADGTRSADEVRLADALLIGDGPISGFRIDPASLLVSVHVGNWLLAEDGQPTVEAVTRYVERRLGLRD